MTVTNTLAYCNTGLAMEINFKTCYVWNWFCKLKACWVCWLIFN